MREHCKRLTISLARPVWAAVLAGLVVLADADRCRGDVGWGDSPTFVVDTLLSNGSVGQGDSGVLVIDQTGIARGFGDSNTFGVGSAFQILYDAEGFSEAEIAVVDEARRQWENRVIANHRQDGTNAILIHFEKADLGPEQKAVTIDRIVDESEIPIEATIRINDQLDWFVDPTPDTNEEGEFEFWGNNLGWLAPPGSPASGLHDMLSTMMHELCHALGFDYHYERYEDRVVGELPLIPPDPPEFRNADGGFIIVLEDDTWYHNPNPLSHTNPDLYGTLDLMHPGRPTGNRAFPSLRDTRALQEAFGYDVMLTDDSVPPGPPVDLAVDPAGWSPGPVFIVDWTNPVDPSGIASAYFKVGGGPPASNADHDGQTEDHPFALDVTAYGAVPGEIVIYVWLEDGVGNASYENHGTVVAWYDPDAPGPPQDLLIEPTDWTASPLFDLFWVDPVDLSGIAGAYVKFGGAPTSNDDWDQQFVDPQENALIDLSGIGDPAGPTPVYLWLEDGAGNADYTQHAVVSALYDPTPPEPPGSHWWLEGTETHTRLITAQWAAAEDISGITDYHVQVDVDSTDFGEGLIFDDWLGGVDTELILDEADGVAFDHTYYFRVRAQNGMGAAGDFTAPSAGISVVPAPGDINADGVVDMSDLDIFVNVLLELDTDPDHVARADLDGNGSADGRDIELFVNAILGP